MTVDKKEKRVYIEVPEGAAVHLTKISRTTTTDESKDPTVGNAVGK